MSGPRGVGKCSQLSGANVLTTLYLQAENQFATKCHDMGPRTCIKEDEKGGGRYGVWMGRKETNSYTGET